ncbi:MAG: hypothetical protein M3N30_00080, partial [Bacteroidota bacterium]|nr:hypothetical protein [Bacteroidota bacterium]
MSYLIDSSLHSGISQIEQKPFTVFYSDFIHHLYKSPAHDTFWLKFELENRSDSSIQIYFFCGDINFTDIYFISAGHSPQYIQGGNLRNFKQEISFIGDI